jgi:hypothetical protein
MGMRVTSTAVTLGLFVAGIALAAQGGQESKDRASERMSLRDQVVKLRVEIELLELDHDAAKADLLEIAKDIREMESEGGQEQMEEAALARMMLTQDTEAFRQLAKKGEQGAKELKDDLNAAFRQVSGKTKAEQARKRKDYANQAAVLAEKRLELADVEKRYNDTRFPGR